MRVALVVNLVSGEFETNLERVINAIQEAGDVGVDLVVFPETALTGLINNDVPEYDLLLGVSVPGVVTQRISDAALSYGVHVAVGLFERDGETLYDSALLFDSSGHLCMKYRRITDGWHSRKADPALYGRGEDVTKVETRMGSFAFLICGDLFSDTLVEQVRSLKPDYVIYPFARNFTDGTCNQSLWDSVEEPAYVDRASKLGCYTLMVNYLGDLEWDPDGVFGGALVVSPAGNVVARYPLCKEGMLIVDL